MVKSHHIEIHPHTRMDNLPEPQEAAPIGFHHGSCRQDRTGPSTLGTSPLARAIHRTSLALALSLLVTSPLLAGIPAPRPDSPPAPPSAPSAVPAPEAPEVPEVPEAPEVLRIPEAAPKAPEAPLVPVALRAPEAAPEPPAAIPRSTRSPRPDSPPATVAPASVPTENKAPRAPRAEAHLASHTATPAPMVKPAAPRSLVRQAAPAADRPSKKAPKKDVKKPQESCDNLPKLIYLNQPQYPDRARNIFIDEVVIKTVLGVDESGKIASAQIEDPLPVLGFGKSVEKALQSASFEACWRDGEAVSYEHQIDFRFNRTEFEKVQAREFRSLASKKHVTPERHGNMH